MTLSRVEQAARNNAIWCDTICRAHGAAGEFHADLWFNRNPVPRFYPNVVTLSNQRPAAAQLAHVQELVAAILPDHWAIKDSFAELDLAALAFQLFFEATWIWRAPSAPLPKAHDHGIQWVRLQDEAQLAQWESAWSRNPANNSSTQQPRLFLPALLADPNVAFIAAYQGREMIAGAIANHTDTVVGLSNLFAPAADSESFWAGCAATAQATFPGYPLVGYESGLDLARAEAVGFEKLQTLRVWASRNLGAVQYRKQATEHGTSDQRSLSPGHFAGSHATIWRYERAHATARIGGEFRLCLRARAPGDHFAHQSQSAP